MPLIDNQYNLVIYGEGHMNDYNALETTNQMKSKTVNSIPPWYPHKNIFNTIKVLSKV